MPKLNDRLPKYRLHKTSGRAVVTIDGRPIYLGPYGSKASRTAYDRVTGEWLANGRRLRQPAVDITIAELIAAYWSHAQVHYRKADKTPTSEIPVLRLALRPLRELYGDQPVAKFGPLALECVVNRMVTLNWTRKSINKHLSRLKKVFRFGVKKEMVPGRILAALDAVEGLEAGRSNAVEAEPVEPVSDESIAAVRPHLTPTVRAMVDLQLLTGMRPGELCAMRAGEIDRIVDPWIYQPSHHKNAHRGHERIIPLGPKCRAILEPLLANGDAYVFSPVRAVAEFRESRHLARDTPAHLGNRIGTNRQRRPKRVPSECYDVNAYRHAIERACERAFCMPDELQIDRKDDAEAAMERAKRRAAWRAENCWTPHQLRHTAATRLRRDYGIEAAQVILGHKSLSVTELYAAKNIQSAKDIMAKVG